MMTAGDGEAIRKAALRALREDLAVAESQSFYFGRGDEIERLKRQIAYAEKMVFLELGGDGVPVRRGD